MDNLEIYQFVCVHEDSESGVVQSYLPITQRRKVSKQGISCCWGEKKTGM